MQWMTESESHEWVSNDSGECESDQDCVVIRGMETDIAHEKTGNTIGKHAETGGTHTDASSKKPKSTMTVEQETFVQKFKTSPSKMDKKRHVHIHVGTRVVNDIRQTKYRVLQSIIDY